MQKVKTSHRGRKCKLLHCKQILSIYNHEEYCHIHLGQFAHEHKSKICK